MSRRKMLEEVHVKWMLRERMEPDTGEITKTMIKIDPDKESLKEISNTMGLEQADRDKYFRLSDKDPKFTEDPINDSVHHTHRRGNEDDLELGIIAKKDHSPEEQYSLTSNKYNIVEDIPGWTGITASTTAELKLPDTPDMMDPTGQATVTGSILQQQEPLFVAPHMPDTNVDTRIHTGKTNLDDLSSPGQSYFLKDTKSALRLRTESATYHEGIDPSSSTPEDPENIYMHEGEKEDDPTTEDDYVITGLSISDRALIVEEDVNFHNAVSADIDLLWANSAPLKDILLYLYDSENTKNEIFKLEAEKYYFSILTSECSYTDIISDNMYTLDYFLSKPVNWFKCLMPRNLERIEHSAADTSNPPATLSPDKMVISSSYNLLSKFQVHNEYKVPFDGLWMTFKDTLYSLGFFMERWYYEISDVTNIKSDSSVYERIDEINKEYLSKAKQDEIGSLVSFFDNNSTFTGTTTKSNLGRIYEAYEMLTLLADFPQMHLSNQLRARTRRDTLL